MRLLIIGNNDGPLRLSRSLAGSAHRVVGVGLQKYTAALAAELAPHCAQIVATPTETEATRFADSLSFDLLVNCFANFKYKTLHHRYPAVNVHPTPLPRYRGRHPLRWALINGETRFGITVHRLADGFDDGAILWQHSLDVIPGWSAIELRKALLDLLEKNWAALLDDYVAGRLKILPNRDAEATHVTRRSPADSILTDWHDHRRVWRKVRALREDAHPARLHTPEGQWPIPDARLGERRFVGFQVGRVVGRTVDEREIVCADGHTVWLRGAFGRALPINASVILPTTL